MELELKEIAEKIRVLFNTYKNNFHNAVESVLISPKRDYIFDKYIELVGGLEEDYLQHIHQYWYADRDEKKQDYTPLSLANLTAALTKKPGYYSVYDFCAGSGSLTLAHWKLNKNITVLCEELDERVIPLLLFNLAIRNIPGHVVNKDVLTNTVYKAYKLTKGTRYATIEETTPPEAQQFDAVVSNPPFNLRWEPRHDVRFFTCQDAIMKLKSSANYAFILHALHYLKDDGSAALILPRGVLTSSTAESTIRAYLVEEQKIDSIITTPSNMFESTNIPTCIMVLKNNKDNNPNSMITMINAKETCREEIRDQRGEGKACHANRVYHKTLNIFTNEHIAKITHTAENQTEEDNFSAVVSADDIRAEDYNCAPSRYITHVQKAPQHRPFVDIVNEINRVQQEKNKIKITMNETIAKKIGMYELYENMKKSHELTANMNAGVGKLLNVTFEKDNYFVLSKNAGEIKIENKDKNGIPSLFMFMIQMIAPHIVFLNEQENRLLAELRDALLPELMSGNLDVSGLELDEEKSA